MEPKKEGATELRPIKGGKRSFSISSSLGSAIGWGLMSLLLVAVGCAVLGGVWCFEQLWNAVT